MIASQAAFDAVPAKTITFLHPERQEELRRIAKRAEHFREKSQGSYAVDVVIPKKHNRLIKINCRQYPLNRRFHLRQQERIAQRFQPRPEKGLHLFRAGKTFTGKKPCNAFCAADVPPRNCSAIQLFTRR